jgi:hypothetical protein
MDPMRIGGSLAVAALLLAPAAPARAAFDGSKPFLCALTQVIDCGSDGACSRGPAEHFELPTFVWVDVPAGELREHRGARTSKIAGSERREGRLLLHGFDRRAWSASIHEESGRLTASAADDGVGFLLFGTCTEP